MFTSPSRTGPTPDAFAFCIALLLLTLLSPIVKAQSDVFDPEPGRGGLNTIRGNVYLPDGRRLEKHVRVRLNGVNSGDLYTTTDANGSFYFRRLAGGTYRITVDAGNEYEAAGETVDLLDSGDPRRSRTGQTVTVEIQLQLKSDARKNSGTVNVALASIPKRARELYEKALKSAQGGDHQKAIEQLKGAIGAYPQFALALNELGVQNMLLGHAEESASAFRSALELAPDAAVFRLNYGILLLQQKEFAGAEAEFARALKLDDASANAHLYRGRALIGLLRYDEAEKELERSLALAGDGARMAYRYLGAIYIERGEQERAVKALETYLRLAPDAQDAPQIREMIRQLRSQSKQND